MTRHVVGGSSRGGTAAAPPPATAGCPPPPRGRLLAYGLTPDDWAALWEGQGGVCAICARPFGWNRPACIDHDHVTGETFGLLCRRCNRDLLGVFGRDASTYNRAGFYLKHPPTVVYLKGRRWHADAPPRPVESDDGTQS